MITFLIFLILFGYFIPRLKFIKDEIPTLFRYTISILIGLNVFMIFNILLNQLVPNDQINKKVYKEIYLQSISDNFGIDGNFFLGSGSLNNNIYYSYYKKMDNGGFVSETIKSDNIVIKYINDLSEPRITYYSYDFKPDSHWNFWVIPIKNEMIIYIPDGSIKSNFILDNK